jgi:hypothetical protein
LLRRVIRYFRVIWSSEKAYTVDALATGGDERRGSLRKGSARWQQPLTRAYLNGETHLVRARYLTLNT